MSSCWQLRPGINRAGNGLFALLLMAAPVHAQDSIEIVAVPRPVADILVKSTPLKARVALNFERALFLNLAAAQQAKLKPFPLIGKMTVKNPLLPGGEATIRGNFVSAAIAGTKPKRTPTIWIDKTINASEDGVISIFAFPQSVVTMLQPSAPAGGPVFAITRSGREEADAKVTIAGEKITLVLDLSTNLTVMNARAAVALENAGLVRRGRTVGLWSPLPGVQLPVERLIPVAGAQVLGVPLQQPYARITEARAKELDALALAGTSTATDEEDAIVVTADRERRRGRGPWISVGQDVLKYCSRIELDRPGVRWALTCAFPG